MNNIKKILLFITILIASNSLQAKLLLQGGYSHEFVSESSGVYKKSIKLRNMGNTPLEIKLYLEDYLFNAKGTSSFTAAHLNKNLRSNSQWIKFNSNRVVLSPGMEKTVSYTMTVPSTRLSGTYWSALIVEPVPLNSVESSQKPLDDKKLHVKI